MNLLQLISSEGYFGAENMLVHLSKALRQLGCTSVAGIFENAHRPNLEVAHEARRHGVPVQTIPCRGRVDWNAVRTIRKCIREHQIDVVHTHGYKSNLYGYMAASALGVPLVATCHLWTRQSRSVQFYDFIDGLLLRRFGAVVGVSKAITDALQTFGVHRDKITLISNGLDFTPLQNATPTLRDQVGSARVIIGTVCRLTEQKGLTYLLEAVQLLLERHADAHVLIVGEGKDREKLEEIVKEKGLEHRVSFAGLRRDIPNVYASIDIFVLSSIDEGMPMALLEALATGKAIVATRVGDVPRLIQHEVTGLLVEARDVKGLAESINRLLNNKELRERLGNEGRRFVQENYSAESMARQYMRLYECLFKQQNNAIKCRIVRPANTI